MVRLEGARLPYRLCVKLSKHCGVGGVLPLRKRNDRIPSGFRDIKAILESKLSNAA